MLKTLTLLSLTLLLAACGKGRPDDQDPRAVGLSTPLGKTLVSTNWCSPTAADQTFTQLAVRPRGYVKRYYVLGSDNSLRRPGPDEHGTWAVVGDQFFMTPKATRKQTRQKLQLKAATSTNGSTAVVTKKTTTETCLSLADQNGAEETYCSCHGD